MAEILTREEIEAIVKTVDQQFLGKTADSSAKVTIQLGQFIDVIATAKRAHNLEAYLKHFIDWYYASNDSGLSESRSEIPGFVRDAEELLNSAGKAG